MIKAYNLFIATQKKHKIGSHLQLLHNTVWSIRMCAGFPHIPLPFQIHVVRIPHPLSNENSRPSELRSISLHHYYTTDLKPREVVVQTFPIVLRGGQRLSAVLVPPHLFAQLHLWEIIYHKAILSDRSFGPLLNPLPKFDVDPVATSELKRRLIRS